MAKKKELNTACKAIFKDGHQEEFNSLEEAASSTGISEAAIKIRCNKKGCGGKDGTLFEWLDEHTKKSYQAKKSRNKGAGLETEIVKHLKEIGYDGVCRAAGESKALDNSKVDIADTLHQLPVNIQAKCTQNLPNYYNIKDACPDKEKPFCLIWKKVAEGGTISPGTVAIIPVDYFYHLLQYESPSN